MSDIKDHKFKNSPAEVCATLLMLSSGIDTIAEGDESMMVGYGFDQRNVDKEIFKECIQILEKYIIPLSQKRTMEMKSPCAHSALLEFKLSIGDIVYEIQLANHLTFEFEIKFKY